MTTLVLARRWDQLGSRLNAMVNAMATAEHLGLGFGYVWVRGADPALHDPSLLFLPSFAADFELEPEDLEGRPVLLQHELEVLGGEGVRRLAADPRSETLLEMNVPFGPFTLPPEDPEVSRARYRRCFGEMGWSAPARALIDLVAAWPGGEGVAAVHLRAGDVISGGWRHWLHHTKHTPLPYACHAIDQLVGSGNVVLVTSDHPALVDWLRRRSDRVLTAGDVVPGYGDLPEILRAFADILLLSRCQVIVGPQWSAFSGLAADLGEATLIRADRLVPAGSEEEVLASGIRSLDREAARFPFLGPLLARDICWQLDVFGDGMTLEDQHAEAGRAVALDPDFAGARARLARLSPLGRRSQAPTESSQATRLAGTVDRHDDPLVEALATDLASGCLAAVLGSPGSRPSPGQRRGELAGYLDGAGPPLARLARCRPFDLELGELLGSLERMLALVAWLARADDDLLDRLTAGLVGWTGEEVDLTRFRPPALEAHRAAPRFEALVRDVERIEVHLSQALGSVLSHGPLAGEVGSGHLDTVRTGPTGLTVVEGWVHDPDRAGSRAGSRAGLAVWIDPARTPSAGAGPAFSDRPDVDEAHPEGRGCPSGFAVPVPTGTTLDTAPAVFAVTASGVLRRLP